MTPEERQFYASEVIKECMVKARAAYPNATLVDPSLDFNVAISKCYYPFHT